MSFPFLSLTTHEDLEYMVPVSRIRAIGEVMKNDEGTLSSILWETQNGLVIEREFKEPMNVILNKLHNVGVSVA